MFEREGAITQPNIKNPSYFTFVNVSGQLVGEAEAEEGGQEEETRDDNTQPPAKLIQEQT